jgi:peptidoglycan/LPS O-acetylase OafA/YrhL
VANGVAYRPDIDGLRAIAVLSVVIFHAFPAALPGGFVGVDLFFVISGYLISGIILAAAASPGGFSALGFYRRRVNRLFPSLLAVLAACLAAGYAWLLSDEFIQLGKHAACSAAFAQNIALWGESGYFDLAALKKPLLHLWTLAIEEQFYIAYPLLLLAALRWTRRPLPAIVLLALASFSANLGLIGEHHSAVFYGLGTRAWELLAGAALSCWQRPGPSGAPAAPQWRSRAREAASWGGAILIAIAVSCLSPALSYPGWWGLMPVAGALLMIAAGPGASLNARLLARPLLVGIGLVSYPLYLWHWPLLSFWMIVEPDADSALAHALLVLAAIVLAILSYRLLERPLRRNPSRFVTPGLVAAMAGIALVGVLGWTTELPSRFAQSRFDQLVHLAALDWRFPGTMATVSPNDVPYCTAGGQGRQTLFWGDSHVQQYGPRLSDLVKGNPAGGRGVIVLSKGGVPALPGVVMDADRSWSAGYEQRFRQLAHDPRVDTIVLASRWSEYFTPSAGRSFLQEGHALGLATEAGREAALAALDRLLAELKGMGKTVYLVQDTPAGRELDPAYIFQRGFLVGGLRVRAEGVAEAALRERFAALRTALAAAAARHGLSVIDPLPLLARDGRFPSLSDQGVPLYKDEHHFRATTVRTLIRYLDVTVADPPR